MAHVGGCPLAGEKLVDIVLAGGTAVWYGSRGVGAKANGNWIALRETHTIAAENLGRIRCVIRIATTTTVAEYKQKAALGWKMGLVAYTIDAIRQVQATKSVIYPEDEELMRVPNGDESDRLHSIIDLGANIGVPSMLTPIAQSVNSHGRGTACIVSMRWPNVPPTATPKEARYVAKKDTAPAKRVLL